MATAMAEQSVQIKRVLISREGIVVTFLNRQKAFFDAQYLFDHQDVSANYPIVKDDFQGT